MTILEQTEKIEYLNYLIKHKITGNAEELSSKLHVSKNTVHRLIETMRQLGCPIEYCKTQKTYYYTTEGGICLKFQQESLDNNQLHKVLGGQRTTFFKKLLTYPKYGYVLNYVCSAKLFGQKNIARE